MQYGSIGWSVGATLGYAQAVPEKRVISFIGDGSFQVDNQKYYPELCFFNSFANISDFDISKSSSFREIIICSLSNLLLVMNYVCFFLLPEYDIQYIAYCSFNFL